MSIQIRHASERGQSHYGGWLKSYHSFSFAEYTDPNHVHFSVLRVLNDDTVAAGGGFPPHPHRDMEIISYVTQGGLEHRDSLGNGSVIRAGEFQRMTAGTGVMHSEFNISNTEPVMFYQIWIMPSQKQLTPSYEQRQFNIESKRDQLCLVVSGNVDDDAIYIHQDCKLYVSQLQQGKQITYSIESGRCAYVHVIEGRLDIDGVEFHAGDGARVRDINSCMITANKESEFFLFDLP